VVARKVLEIVRAPVCLSGRDFVVTGSLGISVFPDDGEDPEALLKNADTAVYRAKERGRDNCQLFTRTMHSAAVERLDIESGLRQAMGRGELLLHYQPILDLRSRQIYGVEALLRWNHPVRGLLSAPEFVPVAESSNLIVPLGLWTLRTSLREVRAWQALGYPDLTVAVNLAARHFQQPDLVDQIADALTEAGVPAKCLVIEITETQTMQNAAAAARTLARLKDLGIGIAIDDFGTGYSSLSYLKHLPIHTLKIDRSFVADITEGAGDAAIARAIHHARAYLAVERSGGRRRDRGAAPVPGKGAMRHGPGLPLQPPARRDRLRGIPPAEPAGAHQRTGRAPRARPPDGGALTGRNA